MLAHKLKRQSLKAGCLGFVHSLSLALDSNQLPRLVPSVPGAVTVCSTTSQAVRFAHKSLALESILDVDSITERG